MIQIKRAYEPTSRKDGYRVLVDRLWPRGIKKENLPLDAWLKDLAPSSELRKQFGHDPKGWDQFKAEYRKQLRDPAAREKIAELAKLAHERTVTLIFGARDEKHNNAVVLKALIKRQLKSGAW